MYALDNLNIQFTEKHDSRKTTQGTWSMAQLSAQALGELILIAGPCPNSHHMHLSNPPQLNIEQSYSTA